MRSSVPYPTEERGGGGADIHQCLYKDDDNRKRKKYMAVLSPQILKQTVGRFWIEEGINDLKIPSGRSEGVCRGKVCGGGLSTTPSERDIETSSFGASRYLCSPASKGKLLRGQAGLPTRIPLCALRT